MYEVAGFLLEVKENTTKINIVNEDVKIILTELLLRIKFEITLFCV